MLIHEGHLQVEIEPSLEVDIRGKDGSMASANLGTSFENHTAPGDLDDERCFDERCFLWDNLSAIILQLLRRLLEEGPSTPLQLGYCPFVSSI